MKLPSRSFPILAALFFSPLLFGQEHPLVIPPQFLTLPIVSRTTATTLVNGHQIFVPTVANEKITNAPPSGAPPGNGGGHGGHNAPPPDFGNPGAVLPADQNGFANSVNNVDATSAADSYQGEPMLMNNATHSALFGAENDIYPGNCSASAADGTFGDCGLSATYSANGGATWQRFKISRNWGGHAYLIEYDPSVAVDSQGRTFVAFGFSDSSGPNGMGAVMGVPDTGSPGGLMWTKTNAISLNGGSTFDDKMWIAADATPGSTFTDRLYIAWDRNKSNNQILEVSTSSDAGNHWTTPVKINDGTTKFERVIYAFPAVAPNHTVYVLWLDYAKNIIFMDKSSNGGVTWGTDVAVATTHIGFGSDIGCNGGRSMAPAPQMAIS
ncbi:MAG: sialidase family protein, partial [Deltaproteobacteria bacterium]